MNQPTHPPLKKKRSRRQRLKFSEVWAKLWRPGLGGLLAAVGVVFLLNPFWPYVQPYSDPLQVTSPGLGDKLPHWLAYEGGAAVLGFIFIAIALLWWAFLVRNAINNTSTLWADACPNCHSPQLKRVHRHLLDRLLNLLGFPVRRYLCEHCNWKGARIDRSRLLK
ncbi:MAG: hypothetical protein IPL28_15490 [Chloroflexi bacterium]|nr:hypothetical protein [Chloroflexota bacterium]MDA0244805.1 hypothetical protein [Chloroflexota bacterium]